MLNTETINTYMCPSKQMVGPTAFAAPLFIRTAKWLRGQSFERSHLVMLSSAAEKTEYQVRLEINIYRADLRVALNARNNITYKHTFGNTEHKAQHTSWNTFNLWNFCNKNQNYETSAEAQHDVQNSIKMLKSIQKCSYQAEYCGLCHFFRSSRIDSPTRWQL